MKPAILPAILAFALPHGQGLAGTSNKSLEQDWHEPPLLARPGVWWHWMGSLTSREGITRDLEAMKKAGIGGATIFGMADSLNSDIATIADNPAPGPVVFTPGWWRLVRHAADEAQRLGLELGIHNSPGYETSGGPWVSPEHSMQDLILAAIPAKGPGHFTGKIPRPPASPWARGFPVVDPVTGRSGCPVLEARRTFYRDIAVLAVPASGTAALSQVVDLSAKLGADDALEWDVPEGSWTIFRFGHTTSAALTGPTQPEVSSLEVDKMNPAALNDHLDHLLAVLKEHLGPHVGTTLTHVLIDSYEAGNASWTPGMREEFLKRRGYDLTPWLPVFAGREIESKEATARLKRDFDRTKQELHRDYYFPIFQSRLNSAGLRFQCEPYTGPWRISEVMPHIDRPMAEFFAGEKPGVAGTPREVIASARSAGKNLIEAEAFTAFPDQSRWTEYPGGLKAMGDAHYCAGVNRLVLHSYAQQPLDDRYKPGISMGQWGSHFSRQQTWWEPGASWIAYLARCQALLQRGVPSDDDARGVSSPGMTLTHARRREAAADWFFIANPANGPVSGEVTFGLAGRQPELWDPVTGAMRDLTSFTIKDGRTTVPLAFAPAQSFFIVFRKPVSNPSGAPNFPDRKTLLALDGQWQVTFDPKWGGPAGPVSFASLQDWARHGDKGIRHYSGTAVYRKNFNFQHKAETGTCILSLGDVRHLARVRLNGRDLGVVWTRPWDVDATSALRDGGNQLEIEVTNVWANRLIGDEQEPPDCEWGDDRWDKKFGGYLKRFPDWYAKGGPRPSGGRYCFSSWNYYREKTTHSLVPSGLLGPVALLEQVKTTNIP